MSVYYRLALAVKKSRSFKWDRLRISVHLVVGVLGTAIHSVGLGRPSRDILDAAQVHLVLQMRSTLLSDIPKTAKAPR